MKSSARGLALFRHSGIRHWFVIRVSEFGFHITPPLITEALRKFDPKMRRFPRGEEKTQHFFEFWVWKALRWRDAIGANTDLRAGRG